MKTRHIVAPCAALAAGLAATTAQAHPGHGVTQGLSHLFEGEHGVLLFLGLWAAFAAVVLLRRKARRPD